MPTAEFRERVLELVRLMAKTGATGLGFPTEYGGGGDIGASVAGFETMAFGDLSILVKVGVQFGLFGGAILQLGSKHHHDAYIADLVTGDLMGCFAMTETGHGSNVQALGTFATYDADAREFVITTPDDPSRKDYIGNAADHATHGRGVRPARDRRQLRGRARVRRTHPGRGREPARRRAHRGRRRRRSASTASTTAGSGSTASGCRAPTCSTGTPRSPRTARYLSDIENVDRRFFTMLGTLIQGRVCVGGAGISASKVALAVAIKYANKRRQFGAPDTDEEELLLDYGMHQRRLLPLLAKTYALHFSQEILVNRAAQRALHDRGTRPAASRAGVAGRRDQGARHLARQPDHPGVPRGLRRRGLPDGQPARRTARRHRRVHHVRGRQPHPAAAGRQGPAHRLLVELRRPRPARHGAVRGQPRGGDRGRAHQRAQAARADQGRAARRRRRQLGPGGRAARPGVPARDVPLARGAHPLRRGAAAEARHRQRDGHGGDLQPGPGPRDRRRSRTRRAAGAGGLRREERGHGRQRQQGRAEHPLRPLRAVHDRGRPGLVDGARPTVQRPLQGDQPRGLLAVPAAASHRRGPRRRVRDPAGDAARGDARGVRQPSRRGSGGRAASEASGQTRPR